MAVSHVVEVLADDIKDLKGVISDLNRTLRSQNDSLAETTKNLAVVTQIVSHMQEKHTECVKERKKNTDFRTMFEGSSGAWGKVASSSWAVALIIIGGVLRHYFFAG